MKIKRIITIALVIAVVAGLVITPASAWYAYIDDDGTFVLMADGEGGGGYSGGGSGRGGADGSITLGEWLKQNTGVTLEEYEEALKTTPVYNNAGEAQPYLSLSHYDASGNVWYLLCGYEYLGTGHEDTVANDYSSAGIISINSVSVATATESVASIYYMDLSKISVPVNGIYTLYLQTYTCQTKLISTGVARSNVLFASFFGSGYGAYSSNTLTQLYSNTTIAKDGVLSKIVSTNPYIKLSSSNPHSSGVGIVAQMSIYVKCVTTLLPSSSIYNAQIGNVTGSIIGDNNTVYDNTTIVDTNTVYNPETDTYYNITSYEYSYTDNSYVIYTETNETITITYGDEYIIYTVTDNSVGDTVTYNYYYYVYDDDSGSVSGSGSGSDDDGSSWWDDIMGGLGDAIVGLLKTIGTVIGSVITGLIELLSGVIESLSSITGIFSSILSAVENLFKGFTDFLVVVFPFLPSEIFTIFTLMFALLLLGALIRKIFL